MNIWLPSYYIYLTKRYNQDENNGINNETIH